MKMTNQFAERSKYKVTQAMVMIGLLALTGCGERAAHPAPEENPYSLRATAVYQPGIKADITPSIATDVQRIAPPPSKDSTLAYTHQVRIEVSSALLPSQLDAVKNACLTDKEAGCTILNIESSTNSSIPTGSISMRLAPGKVDQVIAIAGRSGKINSRSSSAEDLAPELNDTAQKLATLNAYREKLNGVMAKKNLTADQLIAVARELSNTQTQIEESSRTQAGLKHRIDTDLLNINFGVPPEEYSGQYTPITDSIKYFGNHFRSAISAVIDFFAYFLPWIPVIVLGFLGVRKMWQLIRKKPASTSST